MPIVGHCIMESLEIFTNALDHMAEKCVKDIQVNIDQCRYYVEHSMALATALNPIIGYDKASEIVKESLKTGKTVRQLVIEKGYLTKEKAEEVLNPKNLTSPNLK